MTTYAPKVTAPPPNVGGDASPVVVAGPNRGVVLAAAIALAVCAVSALFSAFGFVSSPAAPTHTLIVPPPPTTHSATELAAAKRMACDAWATATSTIAEANRAAADAPLNWNDPQTMQALSSEARITLVQTDYLRSRVTSATPADIAMGIHDYVVASVDQEEATLRRAGSQVNAAVDRANVAIDKVNAACGLT